MTLARSPLRVMQFISSLDHTKLNVSPTMLWHERQLNTTGAATPSIDHHTVLLRASGLVDWVKTRVRLRLRLRLSG